MYSLIKTEQYKADEKRYGKQLGPKRLTKMEAANPTYHPAKIKAIIGSPDTYRYRIGEFRVIYKVNQDTVEVLMITLKPRGDVYK